MQPYVFLEMRRALWSVLMLVSVTIALTLIALWMGPELHWGAHEGWLNLTLRAVQDGPFSMLAPLIAAIPFASSYAIDRNGHFSRQILLRLPETRYRSILLLANGLAGGLALALPVGVAALYFRLSFPLVLLGDTRFFGSGWTPEPSAQLVLLVVLAFVFGFTWATLGLACSVLFRNPFYAIVAPFTIWVVGTIVGQVAGSYLGLLQAIPFCPVAMWSPDFNDLVTPLTFAVQYVVALASSLFVYSRFFRLKEE